MNKREYDTLEITDLKDMLNKTNKIKTGLCIRLNQS